MVTVAFLVPLAAIVKVVAADRAMASADQEARSIAGLLAGVRDREQLDVVVSQLNAGSDRSATVVLPDGTHVGPDLEAPADELVAARGGRAFTASSGGERRGGGAGGGGHGGVAGAGGGVAAPLV